MITNIFRLATNVRYFFNSTTFYKNKSTNLARKDPIDKVANKEKEKTMQIY